LYFIF